jgi:hypothetical protein
MPETDADRPRNGLSSFEIRAGRPPEIHPAGRRCERYLNLLLFYMHQVMSVCRVYANLSWIDS